MPIARKIAADNQADIVVIGAGIVGMLCAWQLLLDGHRVTVIDRLDPGGGCSFGNACMISPGAVVPYNSPTTLWKVPGWLFSPTGPLIVRWRGLSRSFPWLAAWVCSSTTEECMRTGRGMAALHAGSIEAYRTLLEDIGASDLLCQNGQIQVSRRPNTFDPSELVKVLRGEFGVNTHVLDAGDLHDIVPALSESFVSGILFPNNGHVLSSHRVVRSVAEAFQRAGGQFVKGDVSGFNVENNRVSGIRLNEAVVAADKIIIAAGIGSRHLLKMLGTDVPLQAERGYHLTLSDACISLPCPVSNADRSFAVTPMEEGIRLAGTVEIADETCQPNWRRSTMLGELGKEMFPDLNVEPASRWMGSRPSFPDGLPILGPYSKLNNLILAFGNGHYGMTAAPKMAEVVAAIAADRPVPIDISSYAVERWMQ